MVAMLWANQIILGNRTYAAVPKALKEAVKKELTDAGLEHLAVEA